MRLLQHEGITENFPPGANLHHTYGELWRFGWPVMLMQTAESGVAVTANFFLGRLTRPELAIAAFGVLDGMMRVLLGPLRNLTPAVQTLTKNRADLRVILRFCLQLAALFSLVMCLFQLKAVRTWALETVIGLPPELAAYVAPALALTFLLALCMTAASFARGLLLSSRKTGAIAFSSAARIVAVGGVGAIALSATDVNGAVVGVVSLIAAFGTEAVILISRVIHAERRGGGVFQS